MNRSNSVLFGLVGFLLVAATPALSQDAGQENTKIAAITLRLAEGELPQGCSATHGFIEQGLLRVEGVEDARVDSKSHGIKVTYDPKKITPEKLVELFNQKKSRRPPPLASVKGKIAFVVTS